MINLSLAALSTLLGLETAAPEAHFQGISTDTRTLQPGNLFVAIKGDNHDAHLFLDDAQKKGAVAAIVQKLMPSSLPQFLVPDTIKALGALALEWRKKFSLPLVGLTGSVGKTTLKNMIASILRAACGNQAEAVLSTQGNFNNHIGLPLTLSKMNEAHRYAVIEMGMNHFGEISYLTRLARPTVAIINNAAPAHLQGVNDIQGVARAKGEIFEGLSPTGIAVLNMDDGQFDFWRALIGDRRCITFGAHPNADVHYSLHNSGDPLRQYLTLITPSERIEVTLPLLGKHNAMNAVAAVAACTALQIGPKAIKEGLENMKPESGRLQMHSFSKDIRLIDDTYNANPVSLQAAINVLASFSGQRILVLGDMKELGADSLSLHAKMGKAIRQAGIDRMFTYGELSAEVGKNFGGNTTHFQDQKILVEAVKKFLQPNTVLLVKGSRFMKMENVVNALKDTLST